MNALSSQGKMPEEATSAVQNAVRVARRLRKATGASQDRYAVYERESLCATINSLYQWASAENLRLVFKSLSAQCHDDDDDDDDEDGDSEGECEQYYILCVEMHREEGGGRLIGGGALAQECEVQAKRALSAPRIGMSRASLKEAARHSVSVQLATAEYNSKQRMYVLRVQYAPPKKYVPVVDIGRGRSRRVAMRPQDRREHMNRPIATRRGKRTAAADSGGALTKLPSVEECVQFYGKKPHTWSLFGENLARFFTSK